MRANLNSISIERVNADFSEDDRRAKRITRNFLIGIFLLCAIGFPILIFNINFGIVISIGAIAFILYSGEYYYSIGLGFDTEPIIVREEGIRTEASINNGFWKNTRIVRFDEVAIIRILEERVNSANPDYPLRKELQVHTTDGKVYRFRVWDGKTVERTLSEIDQYSHRRTL
jgi:hypothetical protein